MRFTETKLIKTEVTTEIICDKCGKTHEVKDKDEFEQAKFHHIHIPLSYGSVFNNYETASLDYDICDDCLQEELEHFKYNVLLDRAV